MRTFGLIGKNIDYSFSRKYFSEKFRRENIEAEYRNFDLASLDDFLEVIKEENLYGLNVTIPYKEKIIPYLDRMDEHAGNIMAVNTIKFDRKGRTTGYNTDYWGFMNSLEPRLKPHHSRALIFGTGGASKAIAYALEMLGISYESVSRKKDKARFSYEDLDANVLNEFKLIINTTPLGTFPNVDESPKLNFDLITDAHLVFDLVYNPSETRLLKEASARGASTLNGLRMLELQAEKAWEIWNS